MKYLLFILIFCPLLSMAQGFIGTGDNILDTTSERYVRLSPTNAAGNRRVVEKIKDSTYWSIRTIRAFIRAVDSTHSVMSNPKYIIGLSSFGECLRADASTLILDTSNTYASKQWVQSRGYLTSVPASVPTTRTLTINGSSFDLSTDRSWNVGDVLTTASYANPSWITALAYSKLTGAPTIPSTTSQIVEGSNLYYTDSRARNAISAGTGISYNPATGIITNIGSASYTAGTGISIASNVISNTAPDQTVTLTAGRGIAITGTYPNFTIALVTPTITPAARTLNSNFTVNSTKESFVTYTVSCSVTNPLLVGTSSANATLQYSTNGGSSWTSVAQSGASSGVGITVTIQLTTGQQGTLVGWIPANALVRILTTTSGTATVTYLSGSEMFY